MKIRWKKIIASMLVATMVLSSGNITAFAGKTNDKNKSSMAKTEQKVAKNNLSLKATDETQNPEETIKEKSRDSVESTGDETQNPEEITNEKSNDSTEAPKEESQDLVETTEVQAENQSDESKEASRTDENTQEKQIQSAKELAELSKQTPDTYQNAKIILAPHDTNEWDLSGEDFRGLGSDDYPFKGTITFSGEYTGYITLDKSLFNAVSGDATIAALNLKAANNMTDPILTKSYIKGTTEEAKTISLKIDAKSTDTTEGGDQKTYSSFGGVIGTLGTGASVLMNINSTIPALKAAVSGTGSRGFFCNTIGENASLTVQTFTGNADFNITSTDENAGAFVGSMKKSATLNIVPEFAFGGSVTGAQNAGGLVGSAEESASINLQNNYTVNGNISSGNGNAGGLIGSVVNNPVTVAEGKSVSINSASLSAGATGAAGGMFGGCTVSGENVPNMNLTVYTLSKISITSGKYAGGVFGILSNNTNNGTIQILGDENQEIDSTGKGADNYGGLIGKYQATYLSSGLGLENLKITSSHSDKEKTAYSGVVAEVIGKSYVKMKNLTVSVDQQVANGSYFGGLVANCSGEGTSDFFDIGTVQVSSKNNKTVKENGASGGLIGKMEDGVVRLSGKTDLSGIQPGDEGSQYGQLVGNRGAVLVYAVGNGSNYKTDTATGWTFVRDESGKSVSDIGNWGEVIRVDDAKLKEGSSELLNYDSTNHTVTVKGFDVSAISTAQDFLALALTMQCSGENNEGVLHFSSSADLSSQISLTNDINLENTGVTGLMRDDGTQNAFNGSLNGQGHTLTLDIGDAYGVKKKADETENKCAASDAGCGQIYNHSYIGLFAKTGNLTGTVSNLTVSGSIYYGLSTKQEIWVGGVTAFQDEGTASYQNVTSDIAIYLKGNSNETLKATHVGGFIGAVSGAPTLEFTGCKWTGSIQDRAEKASECYLGGYIGSMSPDGGNIKLKTSSIGNVEDKKASINVTQPGKVSRLGGILAAVETKKDTDNKITITANGFQVNGFDISSDAAETTGGFLGYDWHNIDFNVSGLSVTNAKLNAKEAGFGGLVYEAGGHWIVKEPDESQSQDATQKDEKYGIKFGTKVSFNGKSVDDTPSALLVCRGDDYRSTDQKEDNYALYLQLNSKAAYQVDNSVTVTLNGDDEKYFDELVGISMGKYGNGVVSIATENHEKLNQDSCNTYQKQLVKDYENPHTRYYYNLDQYKPAKGDIESGEELVMWTLGQYTEWNLKDYFRIYDDKPDSATYTKIREMKDTIDLRGLSYYPIDYTGKMNITGANIIFDYAQINSCENGNKQLNNANKQHYMMQTGIFKNLTSQEKYAAQIVVTDSKLSGSIGQTKEGVSGALVVGTMEGKVTGNTLYQATIQINGLTLNGIYVDGVENDDYAPLLVNAASQNSTLNIKDVTTSQQYKEDNRTQAATSLFGNIGNETAINMSVSFQNMKLDARTEKGKSDAVLYNTTQSIFTKATFLHSFQYDPKDTASSGSYTFTKDDTVKQSDGVWSGNVTYGLEISNTESGRNQKQQYYYLGEISNPVFVQDAILKTTSENSKDTTCFANGKYLRYVALKEENEGNEYYHEIDINLQSADILKGCGTYDDPFQITSGAQLETVAAFIATGNSNGWNVNLPKTVVENKSSLSTHDTTEKGHYQYKSGSENWKAEEDQDGLNSADVRAYMRNAYYQIENDIELSTSFYGLGGPLPQESTFSGVIVGKKTNDSCPTVYITAQGTTNIFGGLIAFSQGSVVKDLNLEFGGKTASDEKSDASEGTAVDQQAENGIDSCDPMNITITSQKPSQNRDNQSFFGGVIGYVVGGDNIIDGVTLNGLEKSKITVTGDYENIVDIGGYVGLIGGNLESGGGVVFRNIKSQGITAYNNEVSESNEAGKDGADSTQEEYYYRNPFVGRVLDGYAFSEDCELKNTDKNYMIPKLDKNAEKLSVTDDTITINSAQQLWVLSAIVNSGAGGGSGNDSQITYNNDAYLYGRSRTGTYANVGNAVSDDSGEKTDNQYWGGVSSKLTGQVSYLVSSYTSSKNAAKISATPGSNITVPAHRIIFSADCDMSRYGNGFRGIGTTYQDNNSKTNNTPDILKRCIKIKGAVGDSDTQNRTIKLVRNVKEYASEGDGGWWAQGIGLFPVINISEATTVKYLTISGTACISYQDDRADKSHDYIGEASVGGFAGMTANGSSDKNVTFQNVTAKNLTVTGSKYSGGFYGVIGKSSRTRKSGLTEVSSVVGPYTFISCSYENIKVEGGYSAGGFVGTYKNDEKAMTVSGTTALSGSNIGWVNDACLEMYTVDKSSDAKNNAKMKGYSGGGGIVGYYYGGDLKIAATDADTNKNIEADKITLDKLYIYGPQFAYNCDYGLGGLVGLFANNDKNLTIKHITITDTAVEVKIDKDFKGVHTKNTNYYTTPACGLLLGYSVNQSGARYLNVSKAEIRNGYVLNAGICGGLLGRPGQNATIENTTIDGLVVYSQGAASFTGSSKVGGILANNGLGEVTLNNVYMKNVTVVSDGNTGLVQGVIYSGKTQTVKNLKTENCVVATTQLPSISGRYFNENDTDPGSESADMKEDKFAGTAGLLLGANKANTSLLYKTDKLVEFNIGVKNLTLGYYCNDSEKLSYTYTPKTYSGTFSQTLDKSSIGVYISKTQSGKSYAELAESDETKYSDTKQYTDGYLGLIAGAKQGDATGCIKIVGLSVQGGNYPYELNGYNNDESTVKKSLDKNGNVTASGNSNGNNYVIFSDYSGDSLTDSPNTEGTKGNIDSKSNYPANDPATDPYVIINGTSALKVYSSDKDATGMKLTSDGMDDAAKSGIVSDLTQGIGNKIYQQKYQRVKYAKANKGSNGTTTYELANVAEKFDSKTGEYKDRLSTYFEASESNKTNYAEMNDFDVLMIDITKSSEITQMVQEYISVLTNCDQTGTQEKSDKVQYTSLNAYTYKWNGTKFVKQDMSSLIINNDKSVSVRAGAHDNQNDQFTVLDVFYANPGNAREGYHLFIPVVVKKILQTEFSIKMRNGSSAYDSAYTSNAAMLANYGEQFTAQLTYSYSWTADEWNANIAAGTNFLWSYDKQVKLGDAKGSLANSTTRYTLVDMNRREAGTTFFTGNGTAITSTGNKNDAILKFNNLKDSSDETYSSVYLSDLLPLNATTDQGGTLKKLTSKEGATIRIWNAGTSTYDYYGPKTSNDPEDTQYYTVTVGKTGNAEVEVSEVYYLTVNCQEGTGVITQNATLGLDRMTSTDLSALPSRKKKDMQNTYTLGNFYKVSEVSVTPDGEDKTGSMKSETNDYINLDLKAMITVPEEYKNQFDAYAKNDPVYFRFAVQMHNQSQDDTGTDQILTNAVQALSVKLGNMELSTEDYTCEVSNGVLYLLVKNKKGSDFSNTAINAKLRLNYSGGEIDAQFPMRTGTDQTSGITFSTNAAIAYSENGLDGSTMSGSGSNGTKFYRETTSSVGITYRAYDKVSDDGNVSQLGINGKEVADKGGITITTQGTYNATDISGLNTTDVNNEMYPYYLVGSLELQKKTTDSNGNTAYQTVNMSDYITDVSLNQGTKQDPGDKYAFKMELTNEQVSNLATEPIKMDFSYFVYSDETLEKLGNNAQYANYKVILKAHLENKSGTALVEDVSDYLIYTNAKFYNGIISTRDFDK